MSEKRILLKNCKKIAPDNIDIETYLKHDGFKALKKAREKMSPKEVIEAIKTSGLRGRGGQGFPADQNGNWRKRAKGPKSFLSVTPMKVRWGRLRIDTCFSMTRFR